MTPLLHAADIARAANIFRETGCEPNHILCSRTQMSALIKPFQLTLRPIEKGNQVIFMRMVWIEQPEDTPCRLAYIQNCVGV
jgi:hypothetical protein